MNWLKDDPDHVLALLDDEPDKWAAPRVHKVNVRTGERELNCQKSQRVLPEWIADYDGRVRVGIRYGLSFGKTDVEIHYRPDEESSWEILQDIDYFEADRLVPYGFNKDDPNILLVTTKEDRDEVEYEEDLSSLRPLTERRIIGPYRDDEIERITNRSWSSRASARSRSKPILLR